MCGKRPNSYEIYKSRRWGDCTFARASPVSLSRKPLGLNIEATPKTDLSLSGSLVHLQTWRLAGLFIYLFLHIRSLSDPYPYQNSGAFDSLMVVIFHNAYTPFSGQIKTVSTHFSNSAPISAVRHRAFVVRHCAQSSLQCSLNGIAHSFSAQCISVMKARRSEDTRE